jgi:hypothetical protein
VSKRGELAVRKPKKSAPAASVASFVEKGEVARDAKGIKTLADGTKKRRVTLHWPPSLVMRLKMHCATNDKDMSEVTEAAFEAYLANQ